MRRQKEYTRADKVSNWVRQCTRTSVYSSSNIATFSEPAGIDDISDCDSDFPTPLNVGHSKSRFCSKIHSGSWTYLIRPSVKRIPYVHSVNNALSVWLKSFDLPWTVAFSLPLQHWQLHEQYIKFLSIRVFVPIFKRRRDIHCRTARRTRKCEDARWSSWICRRRTTCLSTLKSVPSISCRL